MPFKPGDEIVGKWRGERLLLLKRLGSGAHGTVYLAVWKQQMAAAKVGVDFCLISSEINRLMALNKAQGDFPGPKLFAYDDAENDGRIYPFYIMSYQQGEPLNVLVHGKGELRRRWLRVLLQLLDHLEHLHRSGFVFADWKPQHIVLDCVDESVRFVDIGGVTPIGHELRQWTALYDRGSWQAGLRTAEPGYDLFAVTLLVLGEWLHCPIVSVKPEQRHVRTLCDIIRNNPYVAAPYRDVFVRAVRGEFQSARHYAKALMEVSRTVPEVMTAGLRPPRPSRQRWLWEGCFACSAVIFLSILYMAIS